MKTKILSVAAVAVVALFVSAYSFAEIVLDGALDTPYDLLKEDVVSAEYVKPSLKAPSRPTIASDRKSVV